MKKFVAAIASDISYLPGAIGTMASLRISLDSEVHLVVIFLHNGIASHIQKKISLAIDRLKGHTTIEFKKIDEDFSKFPRFHGDTQLAYARLLLPRVLEHERVIYIDVDMLIFKDVYSLVETKVSDSGLAAVVDRGIPAIRDDWDPTCPFDVNTAMPYFNTGLLVMDMQRISNSRLFDKALAFLNRHPEFCRLHDQSAINYAANGDIHKIDDLYNFQNSRYYLRPHEFIPYIEKRDINIHFVSKNKPWIFHVGHPPEEMFRILLDLVFPEWDTHKYRKNKVIHQIRMFFLDIHPIFYRSRAMGKHLCGSDPNPDILTAKNWQAKREDAAELKKNRPALKRLYSDWESQIQSRLAEKSS
jgi:lipopolysaccharide biosynthesis glycosyltransferase